MKKAFIKLSKIYGALIIGSRCLKPQWVSYVVTYSDTLIWSTLTPSIRTLDRLYYFLKRLWRISGYQGDVHEVNPNFHMSPWPTVRNENIYIRNLICTAWIFKNYPILLRKSTIVNNRYKFSNCLLYFYAIKFWKYLFILYLSFNPYIHVNFNVLLALGILVKCLNLISWPREWKKPYLKE